MPRNSRGRSRSTSPYDLDDWIMQNIQGKLQEAMTPERPEPKKDWWQQVGEHAGKQLPGMIGGMAARVGAGKFKPKGGGAYPGIEGSIARAMKAKAKSIEEDAKLKAELKVQKEKQRVAKAMNMVNILSKLKKLKADLGQQDWERGFKERELAWKEKLAGIKYTDKPLTPEESRALDDKHKESEARRANYYSMIKKRNENDPRLDAMKSINKAFNDVKGLKTALGQQLYTEIEMAYTEFLDTGDPTGLRMLQAKIPTMPGQMATYTETAQELSPEGEPLGFVTTKAKPADDARQLTGLLSTIIRDIQGVDVEGVETEAPMEFKEFGAGVKTKQGQQGKYPMTKAGAKQAFNNGDYTEASRIASKLGLNLGDF